MSGAGPGTGRAMSTLIHDMVHPCHVCRTLYSACTRVWAGKHPLRVALALPQLRLLAQHYSRCRCFLLSFQHQTGRYLCAPSWCRSQPQHPLQPVVSQEIRRQRPVTALELTAGTVLAVAQASTATAPQVGVATLLLTCANARLDRLSCSLAPQASTLGCKQTCPWACPRCAVQPDSGHHMRIVSRMCNGCLTGLGTVPEGAA